MFLSRFQSLEPTYIVPQDEGLRWLADAHSRFSTDISSERFDWLKTSLIGELERRRCADHSACLRRLICLEII